MIVYYYTSKSEYDQIIRTKEFRPSYFLKVVDASYGEGWYFTDLSPTTPNAVLYSHLWYQPMPKLVERFLAFDINPNFLQNVRPHVYRLSLNVLREPVIRLNMEYLLGNQVIIKFIMGGQK
ncbi:MAG: hypothetical protein QXS21_00460 [Thermoproteota archaeon]|nr:hypothetical protein [Candidatus Brockarchaeota archaeon]MBO3768166.1 hypothetical protein [Candidatus Brockarchaeota archaeon]MBO3800869.1 hypothetical protein [Candidatus Brockarchaeota archaeon]